MFAGGRSEGQVWEGRLVWQGEQCVWVRDVEYMRGFVEFEVLGVQFLEGLQFGKEREGEGRGWEEIKMTKFEGFEVCGGGRKENGKGKGGLGRLGWLLGLLFA